MGENFPWLWTIMKVKKISTLEIKSISTFNTRMTMLRGSKVGLLNLLKKRVVSLIELLSKYGNLILMIETEIVMREKIMERILQDTRSSMYLREKISARL